MDHWFSKLKHLVHAARQHPRRTIGIILALVIMLTTVSVASATNEDTATTSPTTTVATITQVRSIAPATAEPTEPAVREPIKLTKAQVRYLEVLHINNLTYNYGDPAPAWKAFRMVARHRGWTRAEIQSWKTASLEIMDGESGYCPNLLRGARLANVTGCVLAAQGPHEDAGFAQLIALHYRPNGNYGSGWLCAQEGLCSKWDIIATPWNSMTSFVALIERSGVQPWCYDARARSIHWAACSNPGIDV